MPFLETIKIVCMVCFNCLNIQFICFCLHYTLSHLHNQVYPGKLDRRDELFCGLWCAAFKPAMADTQEGPVPGLALLGAGVFASTQYVPKLGSLAHLVSLKVIWSRSKVIHHVLNNHRSLLLVICTNNFTTLMPADI